MAYLMVCAIGVALALTWLGPRSSEGLGTLNSLVFWLAHVATGLLFLASIQLLLGRVPRFGNLPPVIQVTIGGVGGAIAFLPAAIVLDLIFQAPVAGDDMEGNLGMEIVGEFAQVIVPFVLIWLLINAPSLVKLGRDPAVTGKATDTADPAAAFWSKVPKSLGRDLVALSAELHYLRVYTSVGDTLILFAFGRAVELLDDETSCQVHRSHWMRLDHVDTLETSNGTMTCVMDTGLQLPVSRRHRKALKLGLAG